MDLVQWTIILPLISFTFESQIKTSNNRILLLNSYLLWLTSLPTDCLIYRSESAEVKSDEIRGFIFQAYPGLLKWEKILERKFPSLFNSHNGKERANHAVFDMKVRDSYQFENSFLLKCEKNKTLILVVLIPFNISITNLLTKPFCFSMEN